MHATGLKKTPAFNYGMMSRKIETYFNKLLSPWLKSDMQTYSEWSQVRPAHYKIVIKILSCGSC